MAHLCPFTFEELSDRIKHSKGAIKLGERIQLLDLNVDLEDSLKKCDSSYVLLGVPEDIGLQAQSYQSKSNSSDVWNHTLDHVINLQHNKFNKGYRLTILGHLDFSEELQAVNTSNLSEKEHKKQLHKLVGKIDKEVAHIVYTILLSGKIPIIVGGGQNNSYGAIKGAALSIGKPINAINFDAFSHFLMTEGRHSGNSFSYAYEEGFLKKYFIFGLQENVTTKSVLDSIKDIGKNIRYNTYEQLIIRKEKDFDNEIVNALDFIENEGYGVDVDLDATTIFSNNSSFSSGFHARELRQFVCQIAKSTQVKYFHVSEGSFSEMENNNSEQLGKLTAILITDFIKSHHEAIQIASKITE